MERFLLALRGSHLTIWPPSSLQRSGTAVCVFHQLRWLFFFFFPLTPKGNTQINPPSLQIEQAKGAFWRASGARNQFNILV